YRVLARLKGLRGTVLDIFGRTAERKMERALLAEFEADLDMIARELAPHRLEAATALASVPQTIRGYGHIKEANAKRAAAERIRLIERFRNAEAQTALQAAE